jgi:hypothetical protein
MYSNPASIADMPAPNSTLTIATWFLTPSSTGRAGLAVLKVRQTHSTHLPSRCPNQRRTLGKALKTRREPEPNHSPRTFQRPSASSGGKNLPGRLNFKASTPHKIPKPNVFFMSAKCRICSSIHHIQTSKESASF